MSYYLHESARLEHLEYVAYYEAAQKGLGTRYLQAFEAAMRIICAAPTRYKIEAAPNIRRVKLTTFPYSIIFRDVDAVVEVLVIAPHRRQPDYWIERF